MRGIVGRKIKHDLELPSFKLSALVAVVPLEQLVRHGAGVLELRDYGAVDLPKNIKIPLVHVVVASIPTSQESRGVCSASHCAEHVSSAEVEPRTASPLKLLLHPHSTGSSKLGAMQRIRLGKLAETSLRLQEIWV